MADADSRALDALLICGLLGGTVELWDMLVFRKKGFAKSYTYNNGRSAVLIIDNLNVFERSTGTLRCDLQTLENRLLR